MDTVARLITSEGVDPAEVRAIQELGVAVDITAAPPE
jgi:hypothetical protein